MVSCVVCNFGIGRCVCDLDKISFLEYLDIMLSDSREDLRSLRSLRPVSRDVGFGGVMGFLYFSYCCAGGRVSYEDFKRSVVC